MKTVQNRARTYKCWARFYCIRKGYTSTSLECRWNCVLNFQTNSFSITFFKNRKARPCYRTRFRLSGEEEIRRSAPYLRTASIPVRESPLTLFFQFSRPVTKGAPCHFATGPMSVSENNEVRFAGSVWMEIIAYRIGLLMNVEVPPAYIGIGKKQILTEHLQSGSIQTRKVI